MILPLADCLDLAESGSRVSGGDPGDFQSDLAEYMWFPRERG